MNWFPADRFPAVSLTAAKYIVWVGGKWCVWHCRPTDEWYLIITIEHEKKNQVELMLTIGFAGLNEKCCCSCSWLKRCRSLKHVLSCKQKSDESHQCWCSYWYFYQIYKNRHFMDWQWANTPCVVQYWVNSLICWACPPLDPTLKCEFVKLGA